MNRLMFALFAALSVFAGCISQQSETTSTPSTQTTITAENTSMVETTVPPLVSISTDPTLGQILVGSNGMTLYIFLNDAIGQSNCYGTCASIWPPLLGYEDLSSSLPGVLRSITRTDGSLQVTYNGMPLYYFVNDKAPGDTNGQNVQNVWFVAQPNMTTFPTGINEINTSTNMSTTLPTQTLIPVIKMYPAAGFGPILVDSNGKALYVSTRDGINVSNYGALSLQTWSPLILSTGYTTNTSGIPGMVGTIGLGNGSFQVTYNGMPLYTHSYDAVAGQVSGNGIDGVWYVATPEMTKFPNQAGMNSVNTITMPLFPINETAPSPSPVPNGYY